MDPNPHSELFSTRCYNLKIKPLCKDQFSEYWQLAGTVVRTFNERIFKNMIIFLPGSGPKLEKAPIWIRIYITNIADDKCFFFPNGAGIVEQLERDDHLGGWDSLVCAWGALEECLLRIGLPLGVHCPCFPALSTIQPTQKRVFADPFFGGSSDSVLWIRIQINLDLDSFDCLVSGSRSMEIDQIYK